MQFERKCENVERCIGIGINVHTLKTDVWEANLSVLLLQIMFGNSLSLTVLKKEFYPLNHVYMIKVKKDKKVQLTRSIHI